MAARQRMINPTFFKNEDLGDLPAETRLLFIGLWTIADREGRLEDRPKRIKADVYPYDSGVDVDAMLTSLANSGFIIRYVVDGERYIAIPTFLKYQKPHIREAKSEIPPPAPTNPVQGVAEELPVPDLGAPRANLDHAEASPLHGQGGRSRYTESESVYGVGVGVGVASQAMLGDDDTLPPMNEVAKLVYSSLPRKFQDDPLSWAECEQFGRDFEGRHTDISKAIEEVRRNRDLPFPKNLRAVLEPDRPKLGARVNGHRQTPEEARQLADDMERLRKSGRFFTEGM